MSISGVLSVPSAVSNIEAQFAALAPQPDSGVAAPSDPFSVLLDAASAPASSSASEITGAADAEENSEGTGVGGSATVDPQYVALAGTGASSGSSPIVSTASQYLGVPYVWGGSTPSGFDCSGLVQYVFGQLGVSLPRTAAEQEQVGTPVASLADAEPGDLLFFEPGENGAPPGEAGHVAIYIGNGQMIAAPETGENVQIQAVPTTPLAIRRIAVPGEAPASTTVPASTSGGATQMGGVSVPSAYAGLVEHASATTGTPAPLLAAILYDESRFDPNAVSSAGAEGIAQIMPGTAAANGIDALDPSSAIPGAANLLSQYHAAFGSWTDAIAAYAAGGGAVEAAGGVPNDGTTPAYVAHTLSLAGMATGS